MTELETIIDEARAAGDPDRLVRHIPYARALGAGFREIGNELLFSLAFRHENLGNPHLPALHGGVIGAFMENAAILHLLWRQETTRLPKVIDFSIDYLRPGRPEVAYAYCDVRRQGKRVANVGVTAWQGEGEEQRIIATARTHFLLTVRIRP